MAKCPHHDALEAKIDGVQTTCTRIDQRLAKGDVRFAEMGVRLGIVWKFGVGLVTLILLGVGGALLGMVL